MTETPPEPHVPPYPACVPAMLHDLAERFGDREAMVRGAERLTFADLERRSAALARGLLARGVGKGSRIALLMPNSPDFAIAFMAVTRIGAIVAPLSTLYQAPELAWILNYADIDMLLIADRYLGHDYVSRLETALPSLVGQRAGELVLPEAPYLRSIVVWGDCDRDWACKGPDSLLAAAAARPAMDAAFLRAVEANVVPADPLCMVHTSGSTAHPKSVVHSHGGMLRHSWQKSHDYWGIEPGERFITNRPMFWVAGLAAVLFHSLLVGSCILLSDDAQPGTILDLIKREGATAMCGAGDGSALRSDPALAAAGYEVFRISNDVVAFAQRTAGGLHYLDPRRDARPDLTPPINETLIPSAYGMTETLSAHTNLPRGQRLPPAKAGACGQPMPGVLLRIADPDTGEVLATGEVGEVQVAGYSLMLGLYKKDRSETFTPDGFYRTGDLAFLDEERFLKFSSRMSEMVKVSGANVAPLEVELCLNGLPQVERSAVIPIHSGERMLLGAAVQLAPGADFSEEAIRSALREQLSSYKVPKRIFALRTEEFPTTATGKILKSQLAAELTARLAAETS